MTPFEPTGAEVPPPGPFDIPTPDVPNANFQTIGELFAKGAFSQVDTSTWLDNLLKWVAAIVSRVVVTILLWVEKFIAWAISLVFKIWNSAEGGTDTIAAAALSGIFKTTVSPSQFEQVGQASSASGLQQDLFSVLTKALGADFVGANAQPIAPSSAGADQFMQTTMRMAIEGWMQGWLFEAGSFGYVKHFGDLKDILERTLGLGRLARRVMGPPVKVLVEDPLTWLMNSTYLPTQLGQGVAIKEYLRGQIDLDTLTQILSYAGVPAANIPALINDARPHLGVAQLVELVNGGSMTQDAAIQELQGTGYDSTTAALVWQAEQFTRQRTLTLQYVAAAEAAMVSRKVDVAGFNAIIDNLTIGSSGSLSGSAGTTFSAGTFTTFSSTEAELIKATAYFKRSATQALVPIGTAQSLLDVGLIGVQDFTRLLVLHGYSSGESSIDQWNADVDAAIDDDLGTDWVTLWELYALTKEQAAASAATTKANNAAAKALAAKTKLATAQAKAAAVLADAEFKGISQAQFETLVLDGLKTVAQYQAFLAAKGLAPDNVAAFTTLLQAKLGAAGAATTATGLVVAGSKAKGLSASQLASAVKEGYLTLADYQTQLQELGYSAEDAQILGEVLQNQIAAAAVKAATSGAAAAALGQRGLNLAQEENAVLLGLQTLAQYQAQLAAAGFAPEAQQLLVAALQAKLTTAQASAAKKLASSGLPGTKSLNLGEKEKLVRAGILSTADYQTALVDAGYNPGDVASQMQLLQLVLTNDQHQAAASGKSSALLTSGGLSMADIRTAVKLGAIPIAIYDQALTAAGVSASDAAVLHASLAAQLANSIRSAAAQKRIGALLTAQGLDLASLEAQVLAGTLSTPAFSATLAGAGVTGSDQAGLLAYLADTQANQAATSALTAGANAAAAAKGLSLAQEAAAVKAGVLDINDYQSFVSALGYDPADVAVLVATEADKLGVTPPAPLSTPSGS